VTADGRTYSTLDYLRQVADATTPELAFSADDRAGWFVWRDALAHRLSILLGSFPRERVDLDAETVETVRCDGYVREKIVFESEPGVSVPAYLLIPDRRAGGPPGAALLCLHGHGRGKVDVAGVASTPVERQVRITSHNYDYAHQLAQRGYVVLAPDARAFGERAPGGESCTWMMTAALLLGKTLVGMRVWDAMRAVDLLRSRPEVDPDRIGCVGLSWGGTHTIYTTALDPRIRVAVVSGYFSSFRDALIERGCCPCQYVPNILTVADLIDVVGLIAPRPLLLENGTEDSLYTTDVVAAEYQKLQRIYAVAGAEDRLALDMFPGGHRWNGALAYEWLDRWL
jgi:dienelactone hydrolase